LGGLENGLASVVTDKIAKHFDENNLTIGLTYSAHAVSCAAGLENLKIMEEGNMIENASIMGNYIDTVVEKLKEKHPSIGDWRNTGLLGCIELVKNRETKEPVTPWNGKPSESEATYKIAKKISALGMFTFVKWNFIFIAPPLNVTKAEIDEGFDIISQAIEIADSYYQA